MNEINSEDSPKYSTGQQKTLDDSVIKTALSILQKRMKFPKSFISCPEDVFDYLKLKTSEYKSEVFTVLFLNSQHGIISCEEMFFGTINGASVHPRIIIRRCIELNAAYIVLSHNHPSGDTNPSRADISITAKIAGACSVIEVKVLDHIIIGEGWHSMNEHGEI